MRWKGQVIYRTSHSWATTILEEVKKCCTLSTQPLSLSEGTGTLGEPPSPRGRPAEMHDLLPRDICPTTLYSFRISHFFRKNGLLWRRVLQMMLFPLTFTWKFNVFHLLHPSQSIWDLNPFHDEQARSPLRIIPYRDGRVGGETLPRPFLQPPLADHHSRRLFPGFDLRSRRRFHPAACVEVGGYPLKDGKDTLIMPSHVWIEIGPNNRLGVNRNRFFAHRHRITIPLIYRQVFFPGIGKLIPTSAMMHIWKILGN